MAVPDFQTLMLPLLHRLSQQGEPVALRSFLPEIADEFQLTDEERSQRLPSGLANLLENRLAWARTYLGKAGLVDAPKRGRIVITGEGRKLLAQRPERITVKALRNYPAFAEWQANTKTEDPKGEPTISGSARPTADAARDPGTPQERIDQAIRELEAALRWDLIERVRAMSPAAFEELIIRLLLAMGYGQGLDELARFC